MKTPVTVKQKKRIVIGFTLLSILLVGLTVRVGWLQIVRGDELSKLAQQQQTQDVAVAAKRGIIYDRNGKELASSITCYTVFARPAQIAEIDELDGKKVTTEEIADMLAEAMGKDAEDVLAAITTEQALVRVAQNLEKEKAQAVRELGISGIEVTEDTRRYYSLGTYASQLLGSVTIDNTGRSGLELQYDQYLSGVAGRWVRNIDVNGNELIDGAETYYEAQDGQNIVLTIDEAIQHYAEKAIEAAMKTTKAKRIMCLIMDPDTGEVLANAVTPGFDPNDPTYPTTATKKQKKAFEKMSAEEQTKYLFQLWRNPIVSDTYEPGSTFKLITVSSALESRVIKPTDTFACNGGVNIAGTVLHCWSNVNHGVQTVKEAVGNSCNPAHAQIATKMGKTIFYKYLDLFGITGTTGVDYPGETGAIMYRLEDVGPVELATMGYGQSISVTPIQLLTAINAIGNGGNLMQPHYVKAITDSEGKTVETVQPTIIRQVLSSKTAADVRDMMEYVVAEGGGGTAKIEGYRVGGKTGTANKVDVGSGQYGDDYYSSFLGMAPMDDPQVSILLIVDSPQGAYYGSQVAAPVARDILEDVLRYLDVEPVYTKEEQAAISGNYSIVPDVVNKPFSEAVGMIRGAALKYSRPDSAKSDDSFIVKAQYPKAGTKVKRKSIVYVYNE